MNTTPYKQYRLHHTKTSLLTALAVVFFMGIGGILLVWAQHEAYWQDHETIRTLVRDIGSMLVVMLTILIVWEVALRRSFRDELLNVVNLSKQLHASGLVNIPWSPLEIDWKALITKAKQIDLLLAYGKTWRGNNKQSLLAFMENPSARLRVILPDYESDHVINELTERFSKKSQSELRDKIQKAENQFIEFSKELTTKGRLQVWRMNIAPVFTIYRFDDIAIVSLYSHKKLVGVPHLVVKKGGQIYDFAIAQLETILSGEVGRAVLVHDSQKKNKLKQGHATDA